MGSPECMLFHLAESHSSPIQFYEQHLRHHWDSSSVARKSAILHSFQWGVLICAKICLPFAILLPPKASMTQSARHPHGELIYLSGIKFLHYNSVIRAIIQDMGDLGSRLAWTQSSEATAPVSQSPNYS